MIETSVNKKIGGKSRAKTAREELERIFADERNPDHLAKDIDLSKKYKVSRHTIYKIRDVMKIPARPERILNRLKTLDTRCYTIRELSRMLNIKYQNLYKIIKEEKVAVKPDTMAIEHLKQFAQKKKKDEA